MTPEAQKFDALVIGAGIAGMSAALALKKRGKRVAVITKSGGATSVSSGAWDFGPVPKEGPFSLESLHETPRWQQMYRRLLIDAPELGHTEDLQNASSEVATALQKDLKVSFAFKKAFCLPTSAGTWKRTFGAQELQAGADLKTLEGRTVGLVLSERWRFRGDLILKKWVADADAMGVRLDIAPFWIDLPIKGTDWPLSHVAARLHHDEGFRNIFIEAIEQKRRGSHAETLLFPPLFLDTATAESVQKGLKVRIAECLSTVEPVAGHRLSTAIFGALARSEIPLFTVSEIRPKASDGFLRSLQIATSEGSKEISAEGYVLATGKFFGGGIHLGYRHLTETVLGLPLFLSRTEPVGHRSEIPWGDNAFRDDQPWAHLGVWADAKWRPLDAARSPALKNVVVCGSVLGGVDFARETIGLGFMAYTGRQSGNVL